MKTYRIPFIIILILSVVLISCKSSRGGGEAKLTTIDMKTLPDPASVKLSELGAKDILYIPLETNEKSVIPNIRRVIVSRSYFLTYYFANIFMFRHDGSFITKIGTVGRGPEEFTNAHDIDINPTDESIYLNDGFQQKFLVFTKEGKVRRTFSTPFRAAVSSRLTGDGILDYYFNHMGNIENSFDLIDTTGKVIKNFPNKYPWTRTVPNVAYMGENIFYTFNGQLCTKEIYCDTVYSYKNKGFVPHLVIEEGDLKLTPAVRTEATADVIMHNYLSPMNLFEFSDYLYYEFIGPYSGKTEGLSLIASKNNGFKALIDPEKDLINDLDGGPALWPKGTWDDNTMLSWTDALTLKTYVSSDAFRNSTPLFPEKKKELEKLADRLKDTDNPVLILIRFK